MLLPGALVHARGALRLVRRELAARRQPPCRELHTPPRCPCAARSAHPRLPKRADICNAVSRRTPRRRNACIQSVTPIKKTTLRPYLIFLAPPAKSCSFSIG
eukprot:3163362-Prymnesium_polylepis.1